MTSLSRPGPVPLPKLLRWGMNQLVAAGKGEHEAPLLLQWALCTDSLLRVGPDVSPRVAEKYRSAIAQRKAGFPLQHITGEMQFRNLTLQAGPGVFAVRPETEMLVEYALPELHAGMLVADLCAGSGAIGLAVAAEVPGVSVIGIEMSPVAAAYAKRNAETTEFAERSEYTVEVGDATVALAHKEGFVDAVLTNPPYIPGSPPLTGEVLFDPEMALYGGGEDGLILPRGLVSRAAELLAPGGFLLMEHAETQGEALRHAATDAGLQNPETLPDLTGRPRFLRATKREKQ